MPTLPRDIRRFAGWSAGGFVVVVPAGLVLLGLLAAGPVDAVDRWVAVGVNALVAPHPTLVGVLTVATSLGATPTAAVVLGTLVAVLLIRRRVRLAAYVAVTAIGGAALSPTLKVLVGRLRPVVPEPVAGAGGYSFPSGHTTSVTIMVGVSLLVLLPAVPAGWRRTVTLTGICVAVLVGLTRVALGVHFLSDVVAGWLLGSAWVALTATAFRRWCAAGRPAPLLEQGLEAAAGPDLELAPEHEPPASPWLRASWLLVGGILVLAVLLGIGWLITQITAGTRAEAVDLGVVRWLAAHRSGGLDVVSAWAADLGATIPVFVLGLVAATLALAALRRWWPVVLLGVGLVGELALFLTTALIVDRPRPPVSAPRRGAASDVELPVRPHRRRDLPLRRRRADHLRQYPVMVAVARRRRRDRPGGHDRTGPALSRCALPDRRAGQRAPGPTVAADGRQGRAAAPHQPR